jgi:uncharacterized repeat protein (TIGR03803 family)
MLAPGHRLHIGRQTSGPASSIRFALSPRFTPPVNTTPRYRCQLQPSFTSAFWAACQISQGLLLAIALGLGSRLSAQAQNYIYQELFAFPVYGATNGTSPRGALVQGSDGNFYGTCYYDGQPTSNCPTCGYGTVFRMSPDGAPHNNRVV